MPLRHPEALREGLTLYLLGGGWDLLTVNDALPISQPLSVALSVRVPWVETNRKHQLEVELQSEDGTPINKAAWQLEIGRPSGLKPGSEQRAQYAFNLGFTIQGAGSFVVQSRINGLDQDRAVFSVVMAPNAPKA